MINTTMTRASYGVTADPAPQPTSESRIDSDSHFNGLYETRQDLRIEGVAEGEIRCEGTLTVMEGARVVARVSAKAVTIAGQLEGDVVCNGLFQIMPTGQVEATVQARRLTVQEGGLYNGQFRMITEDVAPVLDPSFAKRRAIADDEDSANDDAGGDGSAADGADESTDGSGRLLSSEEWWSKMLNNGGDKEASGEVSEEETPS